MGRDCAPDAPPRYPPRRRRNAIRQQLSLADQIVDGGTHERDGVIAISTPSPLTRRVDLKQR